MEEKICKLHMIVNYDILSVIGSTLLHHYHVREWVLSRKDEKNVNPIRNKMLMNMRRRKKYEGKVNGIQLNNN